MSQAGDDTHIVTREGIMPEEEHPRQLQVSSEQHKKDKAEKKHEQRKQRRAKSKACTDRDLVKFRDAQLTRSNSEDAQEQAEEQLVRRESARQREQQRQQRHRLKEQQPNSNNTKKLKKMQLVKHKQKHRMRKSHGPASAWGNQIQSTDESRIQGNTFNYFMPRHGLSQNGHRPSK